jgi:heptosyltransferase III
MITPKKALFIQLRRIGDILMCTPAIRAFKKHYPNCRLDFLAEIPDVLQGNPYIGAVIDVDRSKEFNFRYQYNLIRRIKSNRYDLVVDFLSNPRSAYYSFLSRAATRLSYGNGHRRWAYNLIPKKDDKTIYAAEDRLRLLNALGVPSDGLELNFYPSERDRAEAQKLLSIAKEPIITISPVSRKLYRRWPLDKFAALSDLLCQRYGATILVLAGPGEEDFASGVAAKSSSNVQAINVAGLGILGAIFEKTSLHIGNDNGPKHIAVACGAPTLTIFGPHDPVGWTYPDPLRHKWVAPLGLCDDCKRKKTRCQSECIKDISVDSVWEKAQSMVEALPGFVSSLKKI